MELPIPPEFAWVIPVFAPFLIGLLVGCIVRRTFKLLFALTALIVMLVAFGYTSLAFKDFYDKAMKYLPVIIGTGKEFWSMLPISSVTFFLGLALGLWKG